MPQPHGSPNGHIAETPALKFFQRLASVPLVAGVAEQVSQRYCEVKARSASLSAALAKVEKAVVAVGCQLAAWARLDRRQLEYVDSLACRSLEKLERRYPAALRRRPEEVVADVAAFGRRKAEQMKRCTRKTVGSVLAILPAAVYGVAHPTEAVSAGLLQVERSSKQALLVVDGFLDDFIAAYDPLHTPSRTVHTTVKSRIKTILHKVGGAVKVRLAHEAECLQGRILRKCGTLLNSWQNVLLRSRSSKFHNTPSDHALAAVQHAYLMCALLAGYPGRFYHDFYLHIAHFYPLWITLPEPPRRQDQMPDSSFESTSSGSKHSAEFSDDSFHSPDSE